ncbi:MAG: UDP-N-acetylmuramate dehydrogenase [Cyanobacteria bacterium P01_E01_bin.45]
MSTSLSSSHSSTVLPPACVQSHVSLASYTTFRVGGAAEWFCLPESADDLQMALQWAADVGLATQFIGLGSNLLVSDRGIPGLTLCTRKLRATKFLDNGQFWAAAGASVVKLSHAVADRGWSGWEWAVGVPGTVGGAVTMNAGAHGSSTADSLVSVEILDEQLQHRTLYPDELNYDYRYSIMQERNWIVTGATVQLQEGDRDRIRQQTQAFWHKRHSTQPYDMPSCGSVFRNPHPKAAGWLIEQTGLKGYQIGGAQVAQKHANFILNSDRARASDIHQLIAHVRQQVFDRWSIWLHPEVRVLGEFEVSGDCDMSMAIAD